MNHLQYSNRREGQGEGWICFLLVICVPEHHKIAKDVNNSIRRDANNFFKSVTVNYVKELNINCLL